MKNLREFVIVNLWNKYSYIKKADRLLWLAFFINYYR